MRRVQDAKIQMCLCVTLYVHFASSCYLDKSVTLVSRLQGARLRNWDLVSGRDNRFSFLCIVQAGSGAHLSSSSGGAGSFTPAVKQPG